MSGTASAADTADPMVCDLDEEQAEENACRMEHVVSRNVIVGIEQFLRSGDTHDRILKNTDLSTLYEPGSYEFCMGIYRPEKRYPRILAEEFFLFVPEIRLNVKEDGSFFSLKKRDSGHPEHRSGTGSGTDGVRQSRKTGNFVFPRLR